MLSMNILQYMVCRSFLFIRYSITSGSFQASKAKPGNSLSAVNEVWDNLVSTPPGSCRPEIGAETGCNWGDRV